MGTIPALVVVAAIGGAVPAPSGNLIEQSFDVTEGTCVILICDCESWQGQAHEEPGVMRMRYRIATGSPERRFVESQSGRVLLLEQPGADYGDGRDSVTDLEIDMPLRVGFGYRHPGNPTAGQGTGSPECRVPDSAFTE